MISIGIDVSKGKSTVCFLKPYGEVVCKPFEIQHIESELKHFVGQIQSLTEEVRIVMESTGSYHYPILAYLKEHGMFVSVINPLVMSKYANMGIRRGKTDKLYQSAIVIRGGIIHADVGRTIIRIKNTRRTCKLTVYSLLKRITL